MAENTETKSKLYPTYYAYPIPFDPEVGMDVFSPTDVAPEVEDVDKEFKTINCYNNNISIMKSGIEFPYTEAQLAELKKCKNDILYFIVNYCKIVTLKHGVQKFKLFQYQKNAIKVMHENRFSIFKFPRQMGKCITGDTNITVKINGVEMSLTAAQLYDLIETDNKVESYTPNDEYQILTQEGFKDFDGITSRYTDELVMITTEDGNHIKVTPEHEVKLYEDTFVKAKDLKIGDSLGITNPNKIIDIQQLTGEFKVADMISVKDTRSFAVNDMSAILSNCIDGDNMVTLLDNHTGEIFDIHISELYDYLLKGAKTEE